MAEEVVPVSEIRRVVIQYEGLAPAAPAVTPPPAEPRIDINDLTDRVRRELIRTGYRNPDIFGGRA